MKEPLVSIESDTGWAAEPVWTAWRRENFLPYLDWNSEPSAFQPLASRYTDCTNPADEYNKTSFPTERFASWRVLWSRYIHFLAWFHDWLGNAFILWFNKDQNELFPRVQMRTRPESEGRSQRTLYCECRHRRLCRGSAPFSELSPDQESNSLLGCVCCDGKYEYNLKEQVKEDKIGKACSTNGGAEECIWDFGGKARRKETTRKT
jgi:hypothetical protein